VGEIQTDCVVSDISGPDFSAFATKAPPTRTTKRKEVHKKIMIDSLSSLPSITVTVVKKAFMNLSLSKNNLNATLKKTGRLDKMIVFCVLTIVMTIVYDFVVTL